MTPKQKVTFPNEKRKVMSIKEKEESRRRKRKRKAEKIKEREVEEEKGKLRRIKEGSRRRNEGRED